jgi:hypothetical protein
MKKRLLAALMSMLLLTTAAIPAFAEQDTDFLTQETSMPTVVSDTQQEIAAADAAEAISAPDTSSETKESTEEEVTVASESVQSIVVQDAAESKTAAKYAVNPLYEDEIDKADLKAPTAPKTTVSTASADGWLEDEDDIVDVIRDGMREHVTSIRIKTATPSFDKTAWFEQVKGWIAKAMAETSSPLEGDYIRWNYAGFSANASYYKDAADGDYKVTYVLTFTYYTTAEQETVLTNAINKAIAGFGFTSATSDYTKIRTIYDYICRRVDYDYTSSDDYKLKYTAYAAMINRTAVCQGYSTLFYRMLKQVGVKNRIISSTTHGWNIVQLNGVYYNTDATWDSDTPNAWKYFLCGEKNKTFFASTSHKRSNGVDGAKTMALDYTSAAFYSAYPMAGADYETAHKYTTVITKAKPGVNGSIVEKCSICGTVKSTTTIYAPAAPKLSAAAYTYNGAVQTPTVTVKDTKGAAIAASNYTVTYAEGRKNAGSYKVTVTFTGSKYSGSQSVTYTIKPKSISDMKGTLSKTKYTYDGTAKKPTATVKNGSKKLVSGTDYTVSYSSNTKAGTAKAIITGKGNYSGTLTKTFFIDDKSITKLTASLSYTTCTESGTAKQPTVTVKHGNRTLVNGTDYTVTYKNNIRPGTAKVIITGKGNYDDSLTKTFTIEDD